MSGMSKGLVNQRAGFRRFVRKRRHKQSEKPWAVLCGRNICHGVPITPSDRQQATPSFLGLVIPRCSFSGAGKGDFMDSELPEERLPVLLYLRIRLRACMLCRTAREWSGG